MNIAPIKLLAGSHSDTGETGVGCFMNVIAYLNGEPQITDQSECVCFTVRPMAIFLNGLANNEQRLCARVPCDSSFSDSAPGRLRAAESPQSRPHLSTSACSMACWPMTRWLRLCRAPALSTASTRTPVV